MTCEIMNMFCSQPRLL